MQQSVAIANNKIIVNFDESALDLTCYLRRGWGKTGTQLYLRNTYRLSRFNIIAAVTSNGKVYYSVNRGNNNEYTCWNFLLSLCLILQREDPGWRDKYVFYGDNARYHRSKYMTTKLKDNNVPILFSGPYSYAAAPIEKVFARIKSRDLNPT